MELPPRRFFQKASATALSVPIISGFAFDTCEAAAQTNFDLSMGNPQDAIRLNFNENALGPSPLALEGAKAGLEETCRYALGGLLRPLIADHLGVDKDWVLLGTGSTELQRLAPISHLKAGDNVVSGRETWGGGLVVAENMGAIVKRVPLIKEQGYSFDIPAMLEAVDSGTKIFLVVTPNNPTGAVIPYDDLKKAAGALPKDVLFVSDEAYADYLPDGWKSGVDLIKEGYRNVLVTRTFSKAHAMAGLRTGYGIAHPDILSKIKKFGCGPGSTSIAAFGAVQGALSDIAHAKATREFVQNTRKYYESEATKIGLKPVSGVPPFIMFETGSRSQEIVDKLRERNILIASGRSWNLPDHIRVSYGLREENEAFFRAIKEII